MKIVCPECAAAYEVPDERLSPGRAVRCSRCGTRWAPIGERVAETAPVVVPDAVVPTPAPLPPPTDPAQPVQPASAPEAVVPQRGGRGRLTAAWMLSLVVLGGLGWAGLHYRAEIVHAWPPSERAYTFLGVAGRR